MQVAAAAAAAAAATPSSSLCTGDTAAAALRRYHELWEATHYAGRNPAPQPVSLERAHFPLLREREYLVADKSDGVRYVLFLARVQGRDLALMVDRKLSLYQVPVAASKAYFDGSIFDGELVTSAATGAHLFLVFDAVAVKGSNAVSREPLTRRLEAIRAVFDLEGAHVASPDDAAALAKRGKVVCGGSARGLSFRPKPCFQLRQLDTLLRQLPTLPYSTDGLVFSPVDEPVKTGTHETMLKLKWRHTVDVEVAPEGDDLLVGVGGAPNTAVLRSSLSSLGVCFELDEALRLAMPQAGGEILELELCLEAERPTLRYLARRSDKGHPNSGSTVLRTLRNVREDITSEELVTQLCRQR
jgi:hypothetical protein